MTKAFFRQITNFKTMQSESWYRISITYVKSANTTFVSFKKGNTCIIAKKNTSYLARGFRPERVL